MSPVYMFVAVRAAVPGAFGYMGGTVENGGRWQFNIACLCRSSLVHVAYMGLDPNHSSWPRYQTQTH